MPTVLRALGWDHPRCMVPMRATAAAWEKLNPGVSIEWHARPLAAFNDQPLEQLVNAYDLVVIDHPFVGTAVSGALVLPLDEHVPEALLATLAADSAGPSHASYNFAGHQWALATDAACHVSAGRDDLLAAAGIEQPRSWADVAALARRLPGRVAWPLYPTDCICSLLTLCAGAGAMPTAESDGFDREPTEAAVAFLSGVFPFLHREARSLNPPTVLQRMAETDEIVFVPLAFAYRFFATVGEGRAAIRFTPPPAGDAGISRGALLGGAGLALSARTRHAADAAAYLAWVASPETQRTLIAGNDGQGGTLSAWRDPQVDARTNGFFSATLPTIQTASVRPREAWWPGLQERAGIFLRAALDEGTPPAAIVDALNLLWRAAKQAGSSRP